MFDNNSVSDKQYITPALRVEGCELVKMSRDMDDKSKSYRSVVFHFINTETKAVLDHREFAPGRSINGKALSTAEIEKIANMTTSRVAHITRAYVDEATFKLVKVEDGSNLAKLEQNWDTFILLTGKALGVQPDGTVAKAKGVATALKVIYKTTKGKNYAALPAVPSFISTVNHPKAFRVDEQYDKFEIQRVTPDVERPNNGGGFGAPAGFETSNADFGSNNPPAPADDSGSKSGW